MGVRMELGVHQSAYRHENSPWFFKEALRVLWPLTVEPTLASEFKKNAVFCHYEKVAIYIYVEVYL